MALQVDSRRLLLSCAVYVASGWLLALSFPPTHQPIFTPLALALFALGTVASPSIGDACLAALVGGAWFHYFALAPLFDSYGGMYELELAVTCQILGAFWLAAAWLCRMLWNRGMPLGLALAIAWTLQEYAQLHFFQVFFGSAGAYALTNLAVTQTPWITACQVVDLSGPSTLAFILAFLGGELATLGLRLRGGEVYQTRVGRCAAAAAIGLVGFVAGYGWIGHEPQAPSNEGVRFVAHARGLKFDASEGTDIRSPLPKREASECHVWATASSSLSTIDEASIAQWKARTEGIAVVCGCMRKIGDSEYNSGILIDPSADAVSHQDKYYLIPVSEAAIPRPWCYLVCQDPNGRAPLPRASPVTTINVAKREVAVLVPICYEITISPRVRDGLRPSLMGGGNAVVASIGSEGRLPYPTICEFLLAHARLRAIEVRRPVVRSINSGYCAIIDGRGTIVGLRDSTKRDARPVVAAVSPSGPVSRYVRFGDTLSAASLAMAVAWVVRNRHVRRHSLVGLRHESSRDLD